MTRYVIGPDVALRLAETETAVHVQHQLLAPTLLRSQVLALLYGSVRRGELDRKAAERRLDYLRGLQLRLLGDRVLQRAAWKIADQLGWLDICKLQRQGRSALAMATVVEHYDRHLAPVYLWMAGGAEAALAAGRAEVDALNLPVDPGAVVLDLGAGFGMHAIPLARLGARVTAIDTSAELLRTLDHLRDGLPVRTILDDLRAFEQHCDMPPSAVLCMGDTITHLPDAAAVEDLIQRVARVLKPGGVFVLTFRDNSVPLEAERRFVPVRSDDRRILTCFLEYEPETVRVHDILHERAADGWQTRVSAYRKLRLAPGQLLATLQSRGLKVRSEAGMRGMVRVIARRA